MNRIFFAMIAVAFLTAAYRQLTWDPPAPPTVTTAAPADDTALRTPSPALQQQGEALIVRLEALAASTADAAQRAGHTAAAEKVRQILGEQAAGVTDTLKAQVLTGLQAGLDDPTRVGVDGFTLLRDVINAASEKNGDGQVVRNPYLRLGDPIPLSALQAAGNMSRLYGTDKVFGMLTPQAQADLAAAGIAADRLGTFLAENPDYDLRGSLDPEAVVEGYNNVAWWSLQSAGQASNITELVDALALNPAYYPQGGVRFSIAPQAAHDAGMARPTALDGMFPEWVPAPPGSVFGVTAGGQREGVAARIPVREVIEIEVFAGVPGQLQASAGTSTPPTPPAGSNDSLEGQLAALMQRVDHLEAPPAATPPAPPPPPVEPLQAFTDGLFDMAKAAVMTIVLPLVGAMAFFLGLMKVGEEAGLMRVFARLLRPLMIRLFPDVPPEHPAMSAMILNMAANALGLGNAATPFGIKAMQELDRLNSEKGTATNAMCLFLAINTSSVTLLPTGVIAIRQTLGSGDAAGILPTTLLATLISTTAAITAAKIYQRFSPAPAPLAVPDDSAPRSADAAEAEVEDMGEPYPLWVSLLAIGTLAALVPVTVIYGSVFGKWIVPLMVMGFLTYGVMKGVKVYEVFVAGAREGFDVGVRIIPFLVAILAAVGMLRGSGAIDLFVDAVGGWTMMVGFPAEALPMALLRPLSGSGAYGVMMATLSEYGVDSFVGYLVCTLQGSTETTFYVLAVYFGAVQVQKTRHAMAAALTADFFGIAGATAACWLYFTYNGLL